MDREENNTCLALTAAFVVASTYQPIGVGRLVLVEIVEKMAYLSDLSAKKLFIQLPPNLIHNFEWEDLIKVPRTVGLGAWHFDDIGLYLE